MSSEKKKIEQKSFYDVWPWCRVHRVRDTFLAVAVYRVVPPHMDGPRCTVESGLCSTENEAISITVERARSIGLKISATAFKTEEGPKEDDPQEYTP